MKAPPTSICPDKSKNDKVRTSLSGKKLKLNLDSRSSGNDSSVDGSVIDINVDLESSEDDIDTHDWWLSFIKLFMSKETRVTMSL